MSIDSAFDSFFTAISRLFESRFWLHLPEYLYALSDFLRPYSVVVSLLLLTGITYCYLRRKQLEEHKPHMREARAEKGDTASSEPPANELRWEKIVKHMEAEKESEWRLAILEADVFLDEMVSSMGYRGDSLGEKLKGIEKSDFTTVDLAREAHSVRNRIAHEGAAFALTEREAKRVIGLYETVFREFRFV